VTQEMQKLGYLEKVDPHHHNVGHCHRCNTMIEPYLSEQWFVKMKPLSERPIKAVETGELRFIPERWTKIYLDWMENIRDWCISRQLWWGHQIPAYYHNLTGQMVVATENPDPENYTQDTDVLDTWFSSGLWPFSTMGWPDTDSEDFKKFYPTTTLVTGFDIIFFWVARMVAMGYEFTDKSPFGTVFIHGLIRDEKGQKMSKSKGNTIDPVEIIDKYGSDALRFTLTSLVTYGGQDIKISDERFEYGRNFANKIWNASRFVLLNLEGMDDKEIDFENLTVADKWILHRLNETAGEINKNIQNYRIGEAAQTLYEFFRSTYCDWYVEIAKVQLADNTQKLNTQRVLRYVLERTLRLLHPITPFITEEVWQIIPGKAYKEGQKSIMYTNYPQFESRFEDAQAESNMNIVIEAIKGLRNIRQTLNIPVSSMLKIQIWSSPEEKEVFEEAESYISRAARVEETAISEGDLVEIPPQSASAVVSNSKIIVPLAGLIDIDKEIQRQQKKLDTLNKEKQGIEGRLNNSQFVDNAPEDVVNKAKDRMQEINILAGAIEELLKSLNG